MSDYYANNYLDYHEKTFHIDPASFLAPFAEMLTPGAKVLDIGCGSGRDLLWLKEKGFRVTGFERSPGLAALARQNAGCSVIEGDFKIYDFDNLTADAILAAGSLVHISHECLPGVLENIIKALKPKTESPSGQTALAYLSIKEGTGFRTDARGRTFYLWQDKDLRRLFASLSLSIRFSSRTVSAAGTDEIWLGYIISCQ